jgi:hypothetical protein
MGKPVLLALALVLLAALAFAHGAEEPAEPAPGFVFSFGPAELMRGGVTAILIATIIGSLSAAVGVFYGSKLDDTSKKIVYAAIAIPVGLATLYLAASTVWVNVTSETGGPIHWHADYEIWACGEKHILHLPEGFESLVGTPLLHEHRDNRIHIEGVVAKKTDVELGDFFHAVGGHLEADSIEFPAEGGTIAFRNGDLCNGQPGRLYVFVNGKLEEDPEHHLPAPFTTVPPGDVIKIVFTEKPLESIDSSLGRAP